MRISIIVFVFLFLLAEVGAQNCIDEFTQTLEAMVDTLQESTEKKQESFSEEIGKCVLRYEKKKKRSLGFYRSYSIPILFAVIRENKDYSPDSSKNFLCSRKLMDFHMKDVVIYNDTGLLGFILSQFHGHRSMRFTATDDLLPKDRIPLMEYLLKLQPDFIFNLYMNEKPDYYCFVKDNKMQVVLYSDCKNEDVPAIKIVDIEDFLSQWEDMYPGCLVREAQ
ncbi:MAG: hypothetical protein PUB21_11150 [Bacteroidales bacterium]|nr:hypothetical protein [Bacteroidales bacterium]